VYVYFMNEMSSTCHCLPAWTFSLVNVKNNKHYVQRVTDVNNRNVLSSMIWHGSNAFVPKQLRYWQSIVCIFLSWDLLYILRGESKRVLSAIEYISRYIPFAFSHWCMEISNRFCTGHWYVTDNLTVMNNVQEG